MTAPETALQRPDPVPGDGGTTDHDRFTGAHIVQLIEGALGRPGSRAIHLQPATVVATPDRVTATVVDGTEWEWLVDDLEAVHHATDDSWTLLAVPGISDYGVAVQAGDVARFRTRLDRSLPGGVTVVVAPSASYREPEPTLVEPVSAPDSAEGSRAPHTTGELSEPTAPVLLRLPPMPPRPDEAAAWVRSPSSAPAVPRPWLTRRKDRATRLTRIEGAPASSGPAALRAQSISAWFGDHLVLDRVSLEMPAGQVTALIGPSGCGKSTFLRILNRMHEMIPSAALAGEVLLDGHDIYDPRRKLTDARREIGMVFQKPNPFPAMSIYDNVVASLRLTGTKASVSVKDELVESCLSKAGLWNEVRDRLRQPGGGLSGGQQQRLCIARALAIRPKVLLMDEPCSALDPTSTRRIEQTISELASDVTIVIVTHNMQQALRVSHECAFFLAEQGTPGVIVEHGSTEAMFSTPQDPRTNDYVNGRFG